MGNQICCQQPVNQPKHQQIYNLTPQIHNHLHHSHYSQTKNQSQEIQVITPQITIPQLSPQIIKVLNQHKPFQQQFNAQNDIQICTFGTDIYQGPLDQTHRPTKLGKMYKSNGSLFIGHFVSGKAQGSCFYVMKDGSYYKGQMVNNQAQCEKGIFVTKHLIYIGSFKHNQFNGKGAQKGLDHVYVFEGTYQKNRKKQGVMKWGKTTFQYVYQGKFDENGQFTGKGKLIDPQGMYEGQFDHGQKHGYGVYSYSTNLRYQGFYSHNKKQGQGAIINNDGSIAYKGVFKNGMPNGKGIATSKAGVQFQAQWIDGIDARLL